MSHPHYEFSAGPARVPPSVLKEAQENLVDFHNSGRSIMEMSHRGAIVTKVCHEAEADLRELLSVPDDYAILFVQGGGTNQFSAVPLNLSGGDDKIDADYIVTGTWTTKGLKEAGKYVNAKEAINVKSATGAFQSIPDQSTWNLNKDAKYVFYCDNETVNGVEFQSIPVVDDNQVLVCDMSSNFLSRPVDVSKYGIIFAGAQKNCGIAGVTIVIVKKELLGKHRADTPVGMIYDTAATAKSMYNTPPVWSIYMAGLVFKWIKSEGGLDGMAKLAKERSEALYNAIDNSDGFYVAPVSPSCRSRMNIVFRIKGGDADLEAAFVKQASERNLHTLKGHRSVGGLRASLYNAMHMDGVDALISFMNDFKQNNA